MKPADTPWGARALRIEHYASQHNLVGIQPTMPTSRTIEGVRGGRDEVLGRTLEVIGR
jgi:hypothetical protein